MWRKLFNIAAAISLVLCTAVVAVWVRSYWVSDHMLFADVQGTTVPLEYSYAGMHVVCGGFVFGAGGEMGLTPAVTSELQSRVGRGWRPLRRGSGPASDISDYMPVSWHGFGYVTGQPPAFMVWRYRQAVSVPMWFLVVMFGLAPTVWLRRVICAKKRFRIAHGLCPACGYDLRATPERCPECGAVAVAAK